MELLIVNLVVVFRGLVVEILTVLGITAAMFAGNTFTGYLFQVLALLAVAGAINPLMNLFLFFAPNLFADLRV